MAGHSAVYGSLNADVESAPLVPNAASLSSSTVNGQQQVDSPNEDGPGWQHEDPSVNPWYQLKNRKQELNRVICFFLVLAAGLIAVVVTAVIYSKRAFAESNEKRNIIFMISDGFGPASQTMARQYYTTINSLPDDYQLPLDTIHVGSVRTKSSSSLVTDSAAGATAYSCAIKTYNGAIAVDDHRKPCGTVLEAAKLAGYTTALVVTSRITHATPASFAAHIPDRDLENQIALQLVGNHTLGQTVDIMMGGGYCHFLPSSARSSCRSDDINVFDMAAVNGFHLVNDKKGFDDVNVQSRLPILALFTPDHMSFSIDRDRGKEPSLADMATKALDLLTATISTASDSKGFFIMIEGSRIDMAAHSNDAAAHLEDILAYNEAIQVAKKYVDKIPNTVLISTSDHETGGLSVAKQLTEQYPQYKWNPRALTNVKNSTEIIGRYLATTYPMGASQAVMKQILADWLDITDPTPAELQWLTCGGKTAGQYDYFLGPMVANRAWLGWSTHGHSAVDVGLYVYGTGAESLKGNKDNTEIGNFLAKYLQVDLVAVTAKLQKASERVWKPQEQTIMMAPSYHEVHHHSKDRDYIN
ncbi:alkaline phosphatase [Synchytrium endobioticum]|uniref:Alkaline phosphatase n=1 Tax=Synchytrium endobioticum TaxID=286115 RepID=A0A507CS95_9FUNG|nr:alkaline phosphatase [Synchytrium endobioticum]TPX42009.1 alkaline phosphatase [Synchytrium endobioticum]